MSAEVVARIEADVAELRASGRVREGLESELDRRFEEVAQQSLAAGAGPGAEAASAGGLGLSLNPSQLRRRVTTLARRRFGPRFRRLERRSVLGAARAGESAWLQLHVTFDHLERLASRSVLASRALAVIRPRAVSSPGATLHPTIEGFLLNWVLDQLAKPDRDETSVPTLVLHTECGDGRIVEALRARGLDAHGADPRLSARSSGATNLVAAGAFEYLGAAPGAGFGGLLLSGVVDRLRPGAARALAQLAARSLAPGGVVVLVSTRPELVVAVDPVAADLAPGRPMHPVTWCHLLAHYGLSELTMFEPGEYEAELFAISARRPMGDQLTWRGNRP